MKDNKHIQSFNDMNSELSKETSDSQNKKIPAKSGWYWILITGYNNPTPCYYMGPDSFYSYEEGDECFYQVAWVIHQVMEFIWMKLKESDQKCKFLIFDLNKTSTEALFVPERLIL